MGDSIKTFRDLKVWQKGMELCKLVYSLTKQFPDDEKFGLTSQMRRGSVSIPSNIAEGYGRRSTQDYIRFLQITMGSVYEIQTQLELSYELNYQSEEKYNEANALLMEIERMLSSLIQKLKTG